MTKRTIATTVAAMILAAQLGAPLAAEPTLEQLTELSVILSNNDVAALMSYIEDNPEILEGDVQIAVLLRQFVREMADLPTYLAIEPDLREAERLIFPFSIAQGPPPPDDIAQGPPPPDDDAIY